MVKPIRCQAKDPSSCKYHGNPQNTPVTPQITEITKDSDPVPSEPVSGVESFFIPETTQHNIFKLFKDINANLKDELCENPNVETVEDASEVKTGFSFECAKCGKTHFFNTVVYDKTIGGKALSYLFRQLPDTYRNTQYLSPLMTIQVAALDETFTRHYKNSMTAANLKAKRNNKLIIAARSKVYNDIVVPPADHDDWSSYPGGSKEGLPYIEPEKVPRELLYKFSQCLRKKQHATSELAQKSLVENSQQKGKEVYACPHCHKFHYGRPIEPNRTEEQRYEFAKKTWALPAYREAVSLIVQTYNLQNK